MAYRHFEVFADICPELLDEVLELNYKLCSADYTTMLLRWFRGSHLDYRAYIDKLIQNVVTITVRSEDNRLWYMLMVKRGLLMIVLWC